MNSLKRLVLILGDQLDLEGAALKNFNFATDEVFMVESIHEAQYVWSHKAKIALFLSAMRHFAKQLKELNYPLAYIQSSPLSIVAALKEKIVQEQITQLICVEPGEWRLRQQIELMAKELKLHLDMREDEHFFCSHRDFMGWAEDKKELRLEYFYRLMRKTHHILVDEEGNPEGGNGTLTKITVNLIPKKALVLLMNQFYLSQIR